VCYKGERIGEKELPPHEYVSKPTLFGK